LSGSRSLYDAPRARQTYHLSLHAALPIYRPPRRHDLAERLTSLPEVVADVEVDDPVFWDPGKDRWRRVAGGEFGVRGRRARGTGGARRALGASRAHHPRRARHDRGAPVARPRTRPGRALSNA